jgi:peptide/nickel transport system substrate-binding protein
LRGDRRGISIGMVCLFLLGIVGAPVPATAQAASPSPADKIVFTLGVIEPMVSANPLNPGSYADTLLVEYDLLYSFGVADLAASDGLAYYPPERSADGKTWTFKIRSDAKWSDGVPLTAHDIAFTYNFINEKPIPGWGSELGKPLAHDSWEAPDDTTLIWHMAEPTLTPLNPSWVYILPEHIWGKYMDPQYSGKDVKEFRNAPAVGSGPFVLTEWDGQSWTMEANKYYWGPKPTIDKIVVRAYDNPEALKLALVNGEIDAANGFPPSIFESLKDEPNIATNISTAAYFDELAFNFEGTGDPSLRDLRVRQAIAYSIDKQVLVDRVALGNATVASSVVFPSYKQWSWEPDASQVMGYDPERAKLLLDEAGYKDIDGDGFRETPSGKPWSLELIGVTDWTYSVPEVKFIAGWMNDVGIKTTTINVSEGRVLDLWAAQDFDAYVWGWGEAPDPDFILSIFTTDQCLNWSDGCYSNAEFDKMYQAQGSALDITERQTIVDEMQQFLYEQVPEVILIYEDQLQAYRTDRFTGFVSQPTEGGALFQQWGPVSYLNIKPVSATQAAAGNEGTKVPTWVWAAIAALVIILAIVIAVRRRRSADQTE